MEDLPEFWFRLTDPKPAILKAILTLQIHNCKALKSVSVVHFL
ncbi:hypothetical protein CEV33_1003 [Brucella grignonensis]|uniref:Uncharacterized protein n=1 Tax=Brucella grignonensis TaxID=94627 RepID=A0A256FEJ9_9HYPH|nr:hypothetical protein CEV33_1003 [Brucella grignonensis]